MKENNNALVVHVDELTLKDYQRDLLFNIVNELAEFMNGNTDQLNQLALQRIAASSCFADMIFPMISELAGSENSNKVISIKKNETDLYMFTSSRDKSSITLQRPDGMICRIDQTETSGGFRELSTKFFNNGKDVYANPPGFENKEMRIDYFKRNNQEVRNILREMAEVLKPEVPQS